MSDPSAAQAATPDTSPTPAAEPATLLGSAPAATDPPQGDAGQAPNPDEGQQPQKDGTEPPAKAPEKYEFKFPEGVTLDQGLMEQFEPVARELGLTNEQAQKLADLHLMSRTQELERHKAEFNSMMQGWASSAKSDKEIGGEKFDGTLAAAKLAVDKFGTPELKQALNDSGLGNHPEVIRVFARIGKAIGDDSFSPGQSSAPKQSVEQTLYPTMFTK
jgi:hypothetical protein